MFRSVQISYSMSAGSQSLVSQRRLIINWYQRRIQGGFTRARYKVQDLQRPFSDVEGITQLYYLWFTSSKLAFLVEISPGSDCSPGYTKLQSNVISLTMHIVCPCTGNQLLLLLTNWQRWVSYGRHFPCLDHLRALNSYKTLPKGLQFCTNGYLYLRSHDTWWHCTSRGEVGYWQKPSLKTTPRQW